MDGIIGRIRGTGAETVKKIDYRWEQFLAMRDASESEWFSELCFCILTANASAEMGIRVQDALGYEGFAEIPEERLAGALKAAGARFYNRRAEFIIEARALDGKLKRTVNKFAEADEAREWLVENVKGIGYKEASHFLRNVGVGQDMAIIDLHILRVLREYGLAGHFNRVSRERYMKLEGILRGIARKAKMPNGKLDMYLWYFKTGKVLK